MRSHRSESLRKGAKPPADILHAGTSSEPKSLNASAPYFSQDVSLPPFDRSSTLVMPELEPLELWHGLTVDVLPAVGVSCSFDAILLPRHGRLRQRSCRRSSEGCCKAGKANAASSLSSHGRHAKLCLTYLVS